MSRLLRYPGALLLMGSFAALEFVYRLLLEERVQSAVVPEDSALDGASARVELADLEHALAVLSGQAD
jgi:hypothetical protein